MFCCDCSSESVIERAPAFCILCDCNIEGMALFFMNGNISLELIKWQDWLPVGYKFDGLLELDNAMTNFTYSYVIMEILHKLRTNLKME